jgi:hypothetical protein
LLNGTSGVELQGMQETVKDAEREGGETETEKEIQRERRGGL